MGTCRQECAACLQELAWTLQEHGHACTSVHARIACSRSKLSWRTCAAEPPGWPLCPSRQQKQAQCSRSWPLQLVPSPQLQHWLALWSTWGHVYREGASEYCAHAAAQSCRAHEAACTARTLLHQPQRPAIRTKMGLHSASSAHTSAAWPCIGTVLAWHDVCCAAAPPVTLQALQGAAD